MLFFIILILTLIASCVLPWWAIVIISFLSAFFIAKTSRHAFWSGSFAIFIAWIIMALFKSVPNNYILAKRVADLFHLPHWILLLIVTAIIGGLVAGMSALSGYYLKKAFSK
ncbi:hypothetical protein KXQ82_12685 [Mucilaginibacter sp. HMF5004]|uniref:hypothetical protein n=1 Tax=Mucilaginibacter rivuli TaxID=2857527 RepID=UPI001C5F106E|nr:hypothetical protein [Mucilaginibacter rivuli]MBW4890584.1 hypothetical protein [Mucilaginibacter rivuli]